MSDLPSADASSARPCTNCAASLTAPLPAFCPHCGQETRIRAPTLGEFLQQLGGAYLSTEGALWRTLRLLLTRPGELTRRYLAGQRRHFVLPLRLYLTVSVLVLLALRLVAQHTFETQPDLQITTRATNGSIELLWARAGLRNGEFFCENLPASVCKRLERRLTLDPKVLGEEVPALGQRMLSAIGPAMFLLLPVFALLLKVAYWRRGLRLTEHLVMALHLHAFWFIALAVTLLPLGGWGGLAWLAVPVYTWLAMGRVYGDRRWLRLLRSMLISAVYGVGLLLGLSVAAIWAVLT